MMTGIAAILIRVSSALSAAAARAVSAVVSPAALRVRATRLDNQLRRRDWRKTLNKSGFQLEPPSTVREKSGLLTP